MAHINELIDFTVSVYIVNDGAVLLRHHDKYNAWFPVGGHIELNENPNEAAIRECKEEAGLDIELIGTPPAIGEGDKYTELLAPVFMNIHYTSDTHRHNDMIYFARSKSRTIVQGAEEERVPEENLHWFTADELSDPKWALRETIIFYGKAAIEAASH